MAFYRASIGGGSVPSSWTEVESVSMSASGATLSIGANLTPGHMYHIFIAGSGSSEANAKTNMAISVSSGASNLTLIESDACYAGSNSYYGAVMHYTFIATSSTVVFSKTSTRRMGYILYDTQGSGGGGETASGVFTMTTTEQNIYTGFRPKYIAVRASNATRGYIYNADISTTDFLTVATGSSAGVNNLNTSSVNLVSVDNDGFTTKVSGNAYTGTYYYFAMG